MPYAQLSACPPPRVTPNLPPFSMVHSTPNPMPSTAVPGSAQTELENNGSGLRRWLTECQ
eukprot:2964596-Pyramimonas_sp.AAC.1